jgi:hypothetical protein
LWNPEGSDDDVWQLESLSFDFVRRPETQRLENTMFRNVDPFPSSGKGRERPILLGLLERANLIHWANNIGE